MAVNGVSLVSGITYQSFGPAKSWTWSGGPVQTRNFDLDGRQTSYPYTATGTVNLSYDLGNRITALSGTVAKTYAYDKLDRLTGYGTAITYQYDANGNRTQFKNGTAISTYNNQTTSNRLTSITGTGPEAYSYDLAGNTTAIAAKALAYDARGRLTTHTSGTTVTSFGINAIGQRLVKAGATAALTTRFVYGEEGKLLGEYDNAGTLITEHVYLQDTPIAAIKTAGAYVVQADHLNTPRAILGAGNVSAWTWDSDAFGTTLANEKPSTLATFNYNLRFPAQYYDKETLTHYNYFRDYNPKTGRYLQSDPVGLKGGINTYAYVGGNPVTGIDPTGLDTLFIFNGPTSGNPFGHTAIATSGSGVFSFGNDTDLGSSVTNYLSDQARRRDTSLKIIPTTPQQEQKIKDYLKQFTDRNDVGYFDNCAVRTANALQAGGLNLYDPLNSMGFPAGLLRAIQNQPGTYVSIPRNSSVPSSLSSFNPSR